MHRCMILICMGGKERPRESADLTTEVLLKLMSPLFGAIRFHIPWWIWKGKIQVEDFKGPGRSNVSTEVYGGKVVEVPTGNTTRVEINDKCYIAFDYRDKPGGGGNAYIQGPHGDGVIFPKGVKERVKLPEGVEVEHE